MIRHLKPSLFSVAMAIPAMVAWGDEPVIDPFPSSVRPLLEKYCFDCHDSGEAKASVDLEQFGDAAAIWRNPKLWEKVLVQLKEDAMPPAKKAQPADEERKALVAWVGGNLEHPDESRIPRDPGATPLRRLSRLEYNNTVRDLFGVGIQPADNFPPDGGGGGGFDNNASTLFIPPVLMEQYVAAAEAVVAGAKPELLFHVLPGEGKDEATAASENIQWILRRAFRRPATPVELTRFTAIYTASREKGDGYEAALRTVAAGVLMSPKFLFRIETAQPETQEGASMVEGFAMASRLSYFLWSSMPDDALLSAAEGGRLQDAAGLEAEVRRMLVDPKAHAFAENFSAQWLRTKELNSLAPSKTVYPKFTPALKDAFYAEPLEFFRVMLRDNLPITDFLDCNYTYANETLAAFYGIPGVTGPEMRRVELTDRNRGGLLGMGGILALTSYPNRTSPVLRGKWVMEEILGTPPPPPPPFISSAKLGGEAPKDGLTFRQRLEEHRANVECASCHARMDPLGFGLENFDAIGSWRTEVGGVPIDAAGHLVGGSDFSGSAELKQKLMERKEEFVRNLVEKMLSYALGRGLEAADWLPVYHIVKAVDADGYRSQTLILEITKSFPFRYRRPAVSSPTIAESHP